MYTVIDIQTRKIIKTFDTLKHAHRFAEISRRWKMKATKIVWNGCDNYSISSDSVFSQREEFKPFDAIEIDINALPIVDGEPDLTGVLSTECGKYFRLIKEK